ncbi:MAG: tetratricopeptide repeat protein [bacterium]|nr:tetratricopeptide repeat protein [bacterium]
MPALDENISPETGSGQPDIKSAGPAVTKDAPESMECPVCERVIPAPAPEFCPHCDAPIETILALFRSADLSLEEARRDIRSGDIESAKKRLGFVRLTSRGHRLKVEIIHAILERLEWNTESAIARLNSIKDNLGESDREMRFLVDNIEQQCLIDQGAMAACCEHYNFALFQARRGHFEEARRSLRRALTEVSHHAESHALLGKVQLAMCEYDDAGYHLKRALAIDPANPTATRFLAQMSRQEFLNVIEFVKSKFNLSPVWAVSMMVLLILLAIAITATITTLLSN